MHTFLLGGLAHDTYYAVLGSIITSMNKGKTSPRTHVRVWVRTEPRSPSVLHGIRDDVSNSTYALAAPWILLSLVGAGVLELGAGVITLCKGCCKVRLQL